MKPCDEAVNAVELNPLQTNDDIELDDIIEKLREKDFLSLSAPKVIDLLSAIAKKAIGDDPSFVESWNTLEEDQYMADGGRYRKRRHAVFEATQRAPIPRLMPYQPHYQTEHYNQLNGGIARYFAPIMPDLIESPTLTTLLVFGSQLFSRMSGTNQWHIELHQFRIEARDGQKGCPTPEGVHRDGVDFVIVMMINRVNIESGATTIYNLDNQLVGQFTLLETFDMAIVNDHRVYHGVTPITQQDAAQEAYRDVLVITYKKTG
jgi:hypothetical protein